MRFLIGSRQLGSGAIASQAFDRDEKKDQAEPPQTTGAEETTQWLNSESTFGATSEDDLSSEFAWLKNLDEPEVKSEDPDWLKGLEAGEAVPSASQDEPDWLKGLQKPESKAEDIDMLKDLDASEAVPSAPHGAGLAERPG